MCDSGGPSEGERQDAWRGVNHGQDQTGWCGPREEASVWLNAPSRDGEPAETSAAPAGRTSSSDEGTTDRDALFALYRSAGGKGWKRSDNWGTDADLSQWQGVKVDHQGRVVELDLCRHNLEGIRQRIGTCCSLNQVIRDRRVNGEAYALCMWSWRSGASFIYPLRCVDETDSGHERGRHSFLVRLASASFLSLFP